MSKNKEIEKIKAEKEHVKIEKLEHKELKVEHKELKEPIKEKTEHKEIKEKPEKTEHKEIKEPVKEKVEHKEFKEPIKEAAKEKIEHKEVKEIEKPIQEKGGKELVEQTDPGGLVTQPAAGFAPQAAAASVETRLSRLEAATSGGAQASAKSPVQEVIKIKPEKEHIKIEKVEFKELKHELKELKHELKEFKIELKEHIKSEFELPPGSQIPGPGPVEQRAFAAAEAPVGEGTPEERLARLEAVVFRLGHFIGVDLRPDLSAGALKREPDVAEGEAAPTETKDEGSGGGRGSSKK